MSSDPANREPGRATRANIARTSLTTAHATVFAVTAVAVLLTIAVSSSPSGVQAKESCQRVRTYLPVPKNSSYTTPDDIEAVSANEAWVVGSYETSGNMTPLIERWDGSSWSIVPVSRVALKEHLNAVAAISPDDVWAVGHSITGDPGAETVSALLMHWDGTAWNRVSGPDLEAAGSLAAVAGTSSNDVWAVGGSSFLHWDGTAWSAVPAPDGQFRGVVAISPDDAWAVGHDAVAALAAHWDGTSWSVVALPGAPDAGSLIAIDASSSNDVWAVGGDYGVTLAVRWSDGAWRVPASPPDDGFLSSIAVLSPGNVWAAGRSDVWRWDGAGWQAVRHAADYTFSALTAVPGTPSAEVWAVGPFLEHSPGDVPFVERFCDPAPSSPSALPGTGGPPEGGRDGGSWSALAAGIALAVAGALVLLIRHGARSAPMGQVWRVGKVG